jgi:hypothetical protein
VRRSACCSGLDAVGQEHRAAVLLLRVLGQRDRRRLVGSGVERPGQPYIQDAIAGILISAAILSLEFVVFGRTVSALARRVPFLLYLALRSLGYLTAILMGLAVSAWLVRESAESEPLIERGGVIFSIALSLGANLLYGVNNLLG